jgi:hypothetical protein
LSVGEFDKRQRHSAIRKLYAIFATARVESILGKPGVRVVEPLELTRRGPYVSKVEESKYAGFRQSSDRPRSIVMTKTSYRSLAAAGFALASIGANAAPFPHKPSVPNTDFGYDLRYAGELGAIVAGGFDLVGPAASGALRGIYDLSDAFGGYRGYSGRHDSVERTVSKY